MAKKKREIERELEKVEKVEEKILKRLDEEEKKEEEIEGVEKKLWKRVEETTELHESKVKVFGFADFAQCVVGATLFGIPAMWTPDFWNFIDGLWSTQPVPIPTYKVLVVHLFILFCVIVTLNYAFRKNFKFDYKFLKALSKRVFYIYMAVMVTMILLLWGFHRLTPDITTLTMIRYILSTHSIGMAGAVTFDFILD